MKRGVHVVYQGTFFDGEFLGYADFLVRQENGEYAVWDSKLARHAKVEALLQLAAYADQLISAGISPSPQVSLVLGDMRRESFSLPDLIPVLRERRQRFRELVRAQEERPQPATWMQPGLTCCGHCEHCAPEIERHGDLLLVWGMTMSRRQKYIAQGVRSIRELAQTPAKSSLSAYEARLRDQARMQLRLDPADGEREYTVDGQPHKVAFRVLPDHTIGTLPEASPGDIFFDFEGDPFYQDHLSGAWGLEYLFGVIETPTGHEDPLFRPFWAHNRAEERRAFLDFLTFVEERRRYWPGMHVYHYAPYEKTALRRLSSIHAAGEDVVDDWLRSDLLVDLYATVRTSLRISERSYSIKKLEPLYMGNRLRSGDVTDATGSIAFYQTFCRQRDAGDPAAGETLAAIGAYNEYDCQSTLRLRNWLLELDHLGRTTGQYSVTQVVPGEAVSPSAATGGRRRTPVPVTLAPRGSDAVSEPPNEAETELRSYLDRLPATRERTIPEQTISMVAAATGYHRRERKQFWWGHFDRLASPVEDWADTRDVFLVADAEVVSDWGFASPRASTMTRTLRLRGTASEGSSFEPGTAWCRVYDSPLPPGLESTSPETGRAGIFSTQVMEAEGDGGTTVLVIQEKSTREISPYERLPLALTADRPVATKSIEAAIALLASQVAGTLPRLPRHPGIEILRRASPRFNSLKSLPPLTQRADGRPDYIAAITTAVRDLDFSYLPVQGPPGTGKTHVGAHVVATLVQSGWNVGVVSQSHAAVDNLLRVAITQAGVDPNRVGKRPKNPDTNVPWAVTKDTEFANLISGPEGCLIGGTTWTMTGKQVPPGSFDVLVIEEAGQYSLANVLAVAQAAPRLLLLGDPQQLPQVTQGAHPEPIDQSALGWISQGHSTLPDDYGYFLADSWRMHPNLCAAISRLAYDGKLRSAPQASARRLAGSTPGVHTVFVNHSGNATASAEEALEVVNQVKAHLDLHWDAHGDGRPPRPLQAHDLLVVAAYNAQVNLIKRQLSRAGLADVRVGTVDRFQGQEAPVVILSMACSVASEAPRGIEFLLNRNRINVAVSRGQWRAIIVRSPELTHHMPNKPAQLEELGAFVGLCNTEYAWSR